MRNVSAERRLDPRFSIRKWKSDYWAVLDGEDAEAFAAIRRGYVEHYGPLTFPECQLVEEMATAAWKTS